MIGDREWWVDGRLGVPISKLIGEREMTDEKKEPRTREQIAKEISEMPTQRKFLTVAALIGRLDPNLDDEAKHGILLTAVGIAAVATLELREQLESVAPRIVGP